MIQKGDLGVNIINKTTFTSALPMSLIFKHRMSKTKTVSMVTIIFPNKKSKLIYHQHSSCCCVYRQMFILAATQSLSHLLTSKILKNQRCGLYLKRFNCLFSWHSSLFISYLFLLVSSHAANLCPILISFHPCAPGLFPKAAKQLHCCSTTYGTRRICKGLWRR